MSEQQIFLSPANNLKPRRARIPYKRAIRWHSPLEGEGANTAVKVFVTPRAYVRFCAHAGSDLDNEVGGWLVGKWRIDQQSNEQFIVVEHVLPARYTRQGGTFLTFTHDSQIDLYDELQERFPNRELVGWYHTHPRMGVFLSEYDAWLHRNFFPDLYQVALVIEPHSITGGFFIRKPDGELDRYHYYGFYELNNCRKRSVVHWNNLLSETEMLLYQGV